MILRLLSQAQFLDKNNDALHASLEGMVQESKNGFLKALFLGDQQAVKGKLTFISVSSKFRSQLQELMDKLGNTVSKIKKRVTSKILFSLVIFFHTGYQFCEMYKTEFKNGRSQI